MYTQLIQDISSFAHGEIAKIVFSASGKGVDKATLRPILIKGEAMWQCEKIVHNQAFHQNITPDGLDKCVLDLMQEGAFKQLNIIAHDKTIAYHISKKNKFVRSERRSEIKRKVAVDHNRQKQYILAEGMPVLPLVDLGVFDRNYKIIKSKNDKFIQINRFIEIIDDAYASYKGDTLTIIDFGCGKSYLTFIVYYYFAFIKKIDVRIIGYDLKEDVVEHCNTIAAKYGYEKLEFIAGDISKMKLFEGKVDMIITLHACDTATDHALHFAITHSIPQIFSVPCCQHELNATIACDNEYSLLLKHGLYKERFSALLTDSIRCEVLENHGYKVDVVEFVDFANTPKNAMIRAKLKNNPPRAVPNPRIAKLMSDFNITHTLLSLLGEGDGQPLPPSKPNSNHA